MAKPLRQLLVDWDDRGRAAEPDPRHVATAPPAPDKNRANTGNKGFTAMESLMNYFYWQTLSINEFDSVGHVLRTLLIESDCGAYRMNATAAERKQCSSYLGPYQPGVNAPDPTAGGAQPSTAKATKASSGEKQRGAGSPEAAATPGQPDPSKPHVVLPPGMQQLLDQFNSQAHSGSSQPAPGADAGQMLDFLLAP
jgi:hypothetical protein